MQVGFDIINIPPFDCMCRPRCQHQPSIYSHRFAQSVLRRFSLLHPPYVKSNIM